MTVMFPPKLPHKGSAVKDRGQTIQKLDHSFVFCFVLVLLLAGPRKIFVCFSVVLNMDTHFRPFEPTKMSIPSDIIKQVSFLDYVSIRTWTTFPD